MQRLAGSGALPAHVLDETISDWQPLAERKLTREDAREIVYNLAGFFQILREWHQAARLTSAPNVGKDENAGTASATRQRDVNGGLTDR